MPHDSSLEPILQAVDPRVRLVPERYLRQVLQFLEDAGRPQPPNPAAPFLVSRADLVEIDVLPPSMMGGSEPKLLLITDPDDRMLCGIPKDEQLLAFWRVLFQAAVMEELDRRASSGALTVEKSREKLTRFGAHVEREIRYVLGCEHLVLPDADSLSLYRVFVRVYLDLREFESDRIEDVFPSLPGLALIDEMIEEDLAPKVLKASSRPAGAAGPGSNRPPVVEWAAPSSRLELPREAPAETGSLGARAAEAEARGNHVRAAIIYAQMAANAAGAERDRLRNRAQGALAILVDALGDQFAWDKAMRGEWRQALTPVLSAAATGIWPRAARCLYELQTIHSELSREVYAIDLPEAIRTLGRTPIKRLLPHAGPVLILMHLKKAQTQMLRAGLPLAAQLRADRLFHHQALLLEEKIREEFTPIIVGVLSRAGLNPRTTVEEVGRDKLVAELIDRICERGYLRLGDLRDAIARNQLKMPDLEGVKEFILGDALLRANRGLAEDLDGVYRRGEFYLRWIQRFSAMFFGTRVGRLITIYLAIPFGGSFLALMFAEELHHIGGKVVAAIHRSAPRSVVDSRLAAEPAVANPVSDKIQAHDVEWNSDTEEVEWYGPEVVTSDGVELTDGGELIWYDSKAGAALAGQVFTPFNMQTQEEEADHPPVVDWEAIVGFGVFLLLMIHAPPFRRVVFMIVGYVWWAVRGILWDLPMAVWRSPTVRGLRNSLVFRFVRRNFWSPFLITVLLFAALFLIGVSPWFLLRWGWVVWAGLTMAYNTRWGWLIQDRVAEAISDWWRIVRSNLIPGLIATFIDWFRMLGNWLERMLYAVDEWLRFRSGDSRGSFALKAVLGLIWFPIAYFFRFAFYLLVEPQINPVKHFPVVTVSHKVILAMVPQIAQWLGVSKATVVAFMAGVPGIFGFIAWELRENWRLYKANLAKRLQPVMIGSHGETMRGLLRPGFHSGTVPKLFRKLRRSRPSRTNRYHHDLEHIEEAVARFTQRELIDLLSRSPAWGGAAVAIHKVRFGCQRIVIDFAANGIGHDCFTLSFENIDGRIHAAVEQPGWVDKLTGDQRNTLIAALRGWLDLAAVAEVNGQPRQESPTPLGPGFEDLARTMSWADWVERWNQNDTAPAAPSPSPLPRGRDEQ